MTCPACSQPTVFVAGKCVKCGHIISSLQRAAQASATALARGLPDGGAGASLDGPDEIPAHGPLPPHSEPVSSTSGQDGRPDLALSQQGRECLDAALAFGSKKGIGIEGAAPPTERNLKTAGGWNGYVRQLKEWFPAVESMAKPSGRTNAGALWAMLMLVLLCVPLAPVFAAVVGGVGAIGAWLVTFIATLIVEPLQSFLGETSGLVVAAIAIGKKWVAVMGVVLLIPAGIWGWFLGEGMETAGRAKGNESLGAALIFAFVAGIVTVAGAGLSVQAVLSWFGIKIPIPQNNPDAAEAVVFVASHLPGISLALGLAFGIYCAVVCAKSFAKARVCPHCHVEMSHGRDIALPIGAARLLVLAAKAGEVTAMRGALRARPAKTSSKTPGAAPGVAEGILSGHTCPLCSLSLAEVKVRAHTWGINEWNKKLDAENEVTWLAWSGPLQDAEIASLIRADGIVREREIAAPDVLAKAALECGCKEIVLGISNIRGADGSQEGSPSACWTVQLTLKTSDEAQQAKAVPPAEALLTRLEDQPVLLKDAAGQIFDRVGLPADTYGLWITQDFLCTAEPAFPLTLRLPWGAVSIDSCAGDTAKPQEQPAATSPAIQLVPES